MPRCMMQADSQLAPALAHRHGRLRRWRGWAILWGSVLICEIVLLAFNASLDTYLWRVTRWTIGDVERASYNWETYEKKHAAEAERPFYMRVPPPLKSRLFYFAQMDRLWLIFKGFGEPWMLVIVACLIGLYNQRWGWAAAALAVGAAALAGGLGALISAVDGRVRPTHSDGANVWELFRGFHGGGNLSFPSGHATLAFALAAVLCYVSPRGRPVFVILAAGCAMSRVVMQAHFWSDVIFGAAVGWTVAWGVMATGEKIAVQRQNLRPGGQGAP
jgi:membrane-associated phospholipid phosphatase